MQAICHTAALINICPGAKWTYEKSVDRCYMFEESQSMIWTQAAQYCRNLGEGIYLVKWSVKMSLIKSDFELGRDKHTRGKCCSQKNAQLQPQQRIPLDRSQWSRKSWNVCLGIFQEWNSVLWLGFQPARRRRQKLHSDVWQRRISVVRFSLWQHLVATLWSSPSYRWKNASMDEDIMLLNALFICKAKTIIKLLWKPNLCVSFACRWIKFRLRPYLHKLALFL